ncbi:hypothetical protein ABB37_09830 [Leptomonas pyrrhocoris]|uniref:Uncharacterized protein n=1 Tax=Leptomonas pyrrhocoris TaxID=157538 RepID=A0A0M9FPS4_LEPPY|nr:hypothetical protein ABB37_09830 [Leptomonas pyrrhocoris]KPA73517.1 hypothetical protein ABB37_09830 [Leptomonas pyrrhocoris]|eukprot:XP_015651956.1 hypothetical protein ABB37_09830 [Leptomonas pyrrhocoris]
MRRLYLSQPTESTRVDVGPSILVGQRSLVSFSVSVDAEPDAAYVVAECVPCEDANVVEEQMECLERVLPFGIEVLGVSGSASEVADLVAQLHDVASKELVSVVHGDGHGKPPSCCLVSAPFNAVEVVVSNVSFVEVRCALHSCEHLLPLLVSPQGGLPTVIDGESYLPLQNCVPSLTTGAKLVQLGVTTSTLRIHVVLAPAFVSAKGLYGILKRQIVDAVSAGTTRLVEVQSHNAHISYCCRVEPAGAAEASDFSPQPLDEVFEMIEDATGAAAKHSDMRGCIPVASDKRNSAGLSGGAAPSTPTVTQGVSATKQKYGSETLLLVVGVTIVLIGVLVVMVH